MSLLTTLLLLLATGLRMVLTSGSSRTPGALAGERRATSGSRGESRCAASGMRSSMSSAARRGVAPAPLAPPRQLQLPQLKETITIRTIKITRNTMDESECNLSV